MVKRRKKATTKVRKTAKKKPTTSSAKSAAFNRKMQWKAYKELQTRADTALKKLRSDVKRKAPKSVLAQNHTNLLLLLGECDYMARECMRMASVGKKSRK